MIQMAVWTNVKVILRTVATEIGWNDVSIKHRLVVTQKLARDVASTTCGSKKKNAGNVSITKHSYTLHQKSVVTVYRLFNNLHRVINTISFRCRHTGP